MDRFDVVAHFAERAMGVPTDWKAFFDTEFEWEHGVTGYIGRVPVWNG